MKIRKQLQCALALCAAFGWWGALYPELCLTPDTVNVVQEESAPTDAAGTAYTAKTDTETGGAARLYWELLGTDCSRIRFKSRLAELWTEWKESNDSAK